MGLFLAVLLIYWPALRGALLWDDAGHVTAPALRSLDGLARIWLEPGSTQQYYPVLHSAFWLEHWLWGDATLGYHVMNVLQHAGAAFLFACLLRKLAVPGALFAAACFALHPVGVESVAWISEQKNTLSTVFSLAAALAYLRFSDERSPTRYAIATGWFLLALLTKTVTATLPAALLVILWWQRGRLDARRDVLPLLPWFVAGAAVGLFTASFERTQIGASGSDFDLSVVERGLLAGRVAWFYLGKLIWPANLAFVYPRWTITAESIGAYAWPIATIVVLVVLFRRRRQNRGLLATVLLFGGMLFPVLGFVNVYPFLFSFVADHFQYAAALAIFALAGVGWARLPRMLRHMSAVLVPLALAFVTWRQAGFYRDDYSLYTATLARNPSAWLAHNNLGLTLVNDGRPAEAVPHFEIALRLRHRFAEAENNLGDCLTRLGRAQDAVPHIERALDLQPKYAEAHNNLGVACMALGRAPEGIVHFEQAARLKPDYAVSHFNLGLAIASRGRPDEAIAHFMRAAELDPRNPEPELNWAIALTLTNRLDQALPHFERALQLRPAYAEAETKYGRALATVGRLE
ncbi:MAG TPA: tetratricopeptide repeat protein, partial [Opitutaceae bacterium]|nr:tetratricopeptide repeat protein [Opitutaceae bacterium]